MSDFVETIAKRRKLSWTLTMKHENRYQNTKPSLKPKEKEWNSFNNLFALKPAMKVKKSP